MVLRTREPQLGPSLSAVRQPLASLLCVGWFRKPTVPRSQRTSQNVRSDAVGWAQGGQSVYFPLGNQKRIREEGLRKDSERQRAFAGQDGERDFLGE